MSDFIYIYILAIVSPTDARIVGLIPYVNKQDAEERLAEEKAPYGADYPFIAEIRRCCFN